MITTDDDPPGVVSAAGHHWQTLSDEALLETEFKSDDPETLEGLVLEVPAGAEARVEYAYDFCGTDRPMIRCAHCRYPNHLAGYVMRTEEGQRFLVGNVCGYKIYGARFEVFKKDYNAAVERSSYLRRTRKIQVILPAVLRWIDTVGRDPVLWAFEQTRRALNDVLPHLANTLRVAIDRREGQLYIGEKVRDFAAEERAVEAYDRELAELNSATLSERKRRREAGRLPQKPHLPMYRTEDRLIGIVRGAGFLQPADFSPASEVSDVQSQLEHMLAEMNDAARHETRRMAQFSRLFPLLLEKVVAAIDRLSELVDFFQPANLAIIASWANAHLPERYSAGPTDIVMEDNAGIHTVRALADFRLPSKTPAAKFIEEMNRP